MQVPGLPSASYRVYAPSRAECAQRQPQNRRTSWTTPPPTPTCLRRSTPPRAAKRPQVCTARTSACLRCLPESTPPRRRIWLPTSSNICWESRQIATGLVPLPEHEPAAPGSPPGQFARAVRPAGPSDPSRRPARQRGSPERVTARDPAVGDRTPSHGFAKVPLHCKRLAT